MTDQRKFRAPTNGALPSAEKHHPTMHSARLRGAPETSKVPDFRAMFGDRGDAIAASVRTERQKRGLDLPKPVPPSDEELQAAAELRARRHEHAIAHGKAQYERFMSLWPPFQEWSLVHGGPKDPYGSRGFIRLRPVYGWSLHCIRNSYHVPDTTPGAREGFTLEVAWSHEYIMSPQGGIVMRGTDADGHYAVHGLNWSSSWYTYKSPFHDGPPPEPSKETRVEIDPFQLLEQYIIKHMTNY